MRVVVTGQVGMDKKEFLEQVVAACAAWGRTVRLVNVGQRMYAEAPDVPPGRILDVSLSRLDSLRRSVFKDILSEAAAAGDVIINTHATFRWRHGLFYAFDYDLMKALGAELYAVLVDDVDRVHARLLRDGHANHTLKDLMVWREEEVLATELLAQIARGHGCFYVLARGSDSSAPQTLARLIAQSHLKKAYLSFPMSNVGAYPQALEQIERFRAEMKRHFICFDPGDLEERRLSALALSAVEAGEKFVAVNVEGRCVQIETSELAGVLGDIDGQIYARDFKLIDQSDMIVSLIPDLAVGPGGRTHPGIASGVERELQHAHESGKDVFVIWTCSADPSPFVTETATRVLASVDEAVRFFHDGGYIKPAPAGGLFG